VLGSDDRFPRPFGDHLLLRRIASGGMADVFETPLDFLMDLARHQRHTRTVDGRELTFEPVEGRPDRFRDQETGSLWTIAGKAVEGPMAGESIAVVPHGNHFWFAWAVFKPETEVWGG